MSISQNYGNTKPSLLLDFANVKKLDPRVTFARASEGRYYDGQTVAKAEENLVSYSQEFDNAYWTKSQSTVTANTTTAPDGTTTAESLIEGSGTVTPLTTRAGLSVISGLVYVLSVYAKANTRDWLRIGQGNNAFGVGTYLTDRSVYFDLSTGTVGTVGSTFDSASIVDVGGGWYRCIVIGTAASTTGLGFDIGIATADLTGSYTGDGTSGIYIWGAQLEQRSSVTAYTPTTSQPITNYIPVLQTAAANVARFDHDPVTGESLGLLVEEQRTNLLTYSEQFSSWISGSNITSNTAVSLSGDITADTFTTTVDGDSIAQNITQTGNVVFSIFAKKGTVDKLRLRIDAATDFDGYFDLTTGVCDTANSAAGSAIVDYGDGWYRCIVPGNITTPVKVALYTQSVTTGYVNGTVFLWGAQLEAGAFPTSYIPTVASQVTRSADAASMTGENFSEWYRADEGTLFANAFGGYGFIPHIATITDNTTSNVIEIFRNSTSASPSTTLKSDVYVSGTQQAGLTGVSGEGNVATSYSLNNCAFVVNGNLPATDSFALIPVVDRLNIGQYLSGGRSWNGTIKKIAYYPQRLSNTNLQALTS